MTQTTIYRTEPMATRALGAEIRHDHRRFVQLLEQASGRKFVGFERVSCEVQQKVTGAKGKVRIDVHLSFDSGPVGIEAKLDHELTREQLDRQLIVLGESGTLFVLVLNKKHLPRWVHEDERISVISWNEALACFDSPRLVMDDIEGEGRLLKTTVEAHLHALVLEDKMPGWNIQVKRGDRGMPSVVFERPFGLTRDRRWIRGQIQAFGQGMQERLEDTRFEGFVGVSVSERSRKDFPNRTTKVVPSWVPPLKLLHEIILSRETGRIKVSGGSARNGTKGLGTRKLSLAQDHLGKQTYLAKGYTNWSIGPKTTPVGLDDLDALVETMITWSNDWYQALQGIELARSAQ